MAAEAVTERKITQNCYSRCVGCLTGCLACCWEYCRLIYDDYGSQYSDVEELSKDFEMDESDKAEEATNVDDLTDVSHDLPQHQGASVSENVSVPTLKVELEPEETEGASSHDAQAPQHIPIKLIPATPQHQGSEI